MTNTHIQTISSNAGTILAPLLPEALISDKFHHHLFGLLKRKDSTLITAIEYWSPWRREVWKRSFLALDIYLPKRIKAAHM